MNVFVSAGSFTLICQSEGYENYIHNELVTITDNQTTTLNFSLIPDGISGEIILSESFEGTQFPPNGWTETIVEHDYGIAPDW